MARPSVLDEKYKVLSQKRAGFKSRITSALNNLDKLNPEELSLEAFSARRKDILHYLGKVDETNDSIIDLYDAAQFAEDDGNRVQEMDSQVDYRNSVTDKLATFERVLSKDDTKKKPDNEFKIGVKMPEIKCKTFSGKSTDKFEFKNFLKQFQNCVDSCERLTDSGKLNYLKGYLTDYAFSTISHLSISDENYQVAISTLKDEFLDEKFIIDESLKQLLVMHPKYDANFVGVKVYVNTCKNILHELKIYGVDLLNEGSAGCTLISHIIFQKLPSSVKRELIRKANDNYPTIVELFANFNEILKTLLKTTNQNRHEMKDESVRPKNQNKFNKFNGKNSPQNFPDANQGKRSTLENFETSTSPSNEQSRSRFCKFCVSHGHSMTYCTRFKTVDARKARCKELRLCAFCSSNKHTNEECPGKENKLSFPCYFCNSNAHITALCHRIKIGKPTVSNLCINMNTISSYQPYLLPIVTLSFKRGKYSHKVKCLLDDGSQRSYISQEVMDILNCDVYNWSHLDYDVKTFLGSLKRSFKECVMDISIPGGREMPLPVLIDKEFDIKLHVSDLPIAVNNIKSQGLKLADPFLDEHGEVICLQGLLGVDIIQFIPQMDKIKCMNGAAWKLATGIVPFGNIMHFLHQNQITSIEDEISARSNNSSTCINFINAVQTYGDDNPTHINYVLKPKKTYFSPLEDTFPESSVEQGLENMFGLESVGCSTISDTQSIYDIDKVEDFKSKIKFKDQKYSVALPWHEEIVKEVPSNENVAIAILGKVVERLKKNNLFEAYSNVFAKQLEDNIIERIDVSPETFHEHVWISHRPVVKTEANVSTKVRPVFNCSLKVDKSPSLNEAAYAGINLMSDLTKLALYFRSNKYVMLSDIKQAFLQIDLSSEQDKNRFSFFMMENDQLVAYRYRTIIFGFNASPFILNFVIKHHADRYPDDECTKILKSNFYVDNLIITGNSVDELNTLYEDSSKRMKEGGFLLRSWNSNSEELKNKFIQDDTFVQHGNNYEKVLGYKYLVDTDTIQLADSNLDPSADTKRNILSQISKVFDPLGLCLPVTTKGKILMRDMWSQKLSWDEEVPIHNKEAWSKLCSDLDKLPEVTFPRNCVNEVEGEDSENNLFMFCDASKLCYGFSVYNVCNGKSQLVYAKAKVAPQRKRSLPTLELLSVYLGMKCLPLVLDSFPNIMFKNIYVVVDSQIVLSWLLSERVRTKNVFTLNRIKDISVFEQNISSKYQTSV